LEREGGLVEGPGQERGRKKVKIHIEETKNKKERKKKEKKGGTREKGCPTMEKPKQTQRNFCPGGGTGVLEQVNHKREKVRVGKGWSTNMDANT